jgi:hypothetical protein
MLDFVFLYQRRGRHGDHEDLATFLSSALSSRFVTFTKSSDVIYQNFLLRHFKQVISNSHAYKLHYMRYLGEAFK